MANKNFVVKNGLTVGNLTIDADSGNITTTGNLVTSGIRTDAYFYANGAPFANTGYVGSKGDTGLGFTIAKTYSSVAALTADTSPTGIVAGQFAIIDTGNVNDAENSRLYLWTGSTYNYVNDLSGAIGLTGPQGTAGYTGSAGTSGYTGSAGTNGYTGSAGTAGYTGSTGYAGSAGTNGYTGSASTVAGYTGSAGVGYTGSAGPISGTITTSATKPSSPSLGDWWYNTARDTMIRYINDGANNIWVEISGPEYDFGMSAADKAIVLATASRPISIDYLVVAGGGAGGYTSGVSANGGAGGGAGGLVYNTSNIALVTSLTITVGAGGAASTGSSSGGGNSVVSGTNFTTVTALGGGQGGWGAYNNDNSGPGTSGGSGGGGVGFKTGGAGLQPTSTSGGYGNAGGTANNGTSGGGGAGAAGQGGGSPNPYSGSGGIGKEWPAASGTYYAGGGGAGAAGGTGAAGGLGGGGAGSSTAGVAGNSGTANTGGGGGGGNGTGAANAGGAGGSGVVIIRYLDSYSPFASTTGNPTYTVSGGYRTYVWTSSGSVTF